MKKKKTFASGSTVYFFFKFGIWILTGHSAVLHGCTVEDEAFVGMGAVLLDGVVVEKHGMVAAGALVRQNTKIPAGEVLLSFSIIVTKILMP